MGFGSFSPLHSLGRWRVDVGFGAGPNMLTMTLTTSDQREDGVLVLHPAQGPRMTRGE